MDLIVHFFIANICTPFTFKFNPKSINNNYGRANNLSIRNGKRKKNLESHGTKHVRFALGKHTVAHAFTYIYVCQSLFSAILRDILLCIRMRPCHPCNNGPHQILMA